MLSYGYDKAILCVLQRSAGKVGHSNVGDFGYVPSLMAALPDSATVSDSSIASRSRQLKVWAG